MTFMAPQGVVRIRLSEVLREKGLTQKDLSEKTGVSRAAISNMVHHPRGIHIDTLRSICEVLNVKPGDLIVYEEHES